MRRVSLRVGASPIGEGMTWAYDKGQQLGHFLIPIYIMAMQGHDALGRHRTIPFRVFRFGVQCKDGKTARVVGLANQQTHVIKAWLPDYKVHSARSLENGGWQVYGNFLIHDGPDHPGEVFATIGCVEVHGRNGFVRFNDTLIELAGPPAGSRNEQLHAIARSGLLSITYQRAARPALKKAP